MQKRTGQLIEEALKKLGMSQRKLAKRARVSQGSISMWINGENVPRLDSVDRVLLVIPEDIIGVDREQFLVMLENERFHQKVEAAERTREIQTSGIVPDREACGAAASRVMEDPAGIRAPAAKHTAIKAAIDMELHKDQTDWKKIDRLRAMIGDEELGKDKT